MALDDAWMRNANCLGSDLSIFFLEKSQTSLNREKIVKAKALCEECPVRKDCLKYALAHNIRDGIWGGMTEHERRKHFPRSIRLRISKFWFKTHPHARRILPPSEYTPRSKKGGDSSGRKSA